jgi:hypothetical protein
MERIDRSERSERLKQNRAQHMRCAAPFFAFVKEQSASEVVRLSR